jgi:hypothetical protein
MPGGDCLIISFARSKSKPSKAQGEARLNVATLPHWMVENLAHVEVGDVKPKLWLIVDFPRVVLRIELADG